MYSVWKDNKYNNKINYFDWYYQEQIIGYYFLPFLISIMLYLLPPTHSLIRDWCPSARQSKSVNLRGRERERERERERSQIIAYFNVFLA